jgi:Type IV secretion system pilin
VFFFIFFSRDVYWLQQDLTNTVQRLIPTVQSDNRVDYVHIAREVQFWLFVFVGIIAVSYMIYIGTKLLFAPGNTEEMTSAMKSMGYIVIWLALIPFAYFIVQLLSNIRLW